MSFSGKDPLVRQLYEFDEQIKDLSQGVRPLSRVLWKYRHRITVEQLSSSFQREVLSGGGGKFKVLDAFLKQVTSTYYCKGLGFCTTKIFLVIPQTGNINILLQRVGVLCYKDYSCNSNPFFCLNFGQHLLVKNRRQFSFKSLSLFVFSFLTNTGTQVAFRSVSTRCCSPPASINGQIPPKN